MIGGEQDDDQCERLCRTVERDELLAYIRTFEENEKKGDRTGKEWQRMPSPDVQYQMDLEYLAAVCLVLAEKYREERE